MHPLGSTRTAVRNNHAFIAPDSHVPGPIPGWTYSTGVTLISPRMMGKPQFSQMLIQMETGAESAEPLSGVERFVYVLDGSVQLSIGEESSKLMTGFYAFLPAGTRHWLSVKESAQLIMFEKRYVPTDLGDGVAPDVQVGNAWSVSAEPFLGDPAAQLRTLLPTSLDFDMAVNLFTFQPGAALPFVETHVMEHGLYLTEGQGIYRLDEHYYPIQAGDSIWMGAYSQQWFCAIGKTQSTYLYYKDVNRDPLQSE